MIINIAFLTSILFLVVTFFINPNLTLEKDIFYNTQKKPKITRTVLCSQVSIDIPVSYVTDKSSNSKCIFRTIDHKFKSEGFGSYQVISGSEIVVTSETTAFLGNSDYTKYEAHEASNLINKSFMGDKTGDPSYLKTYLSDSNQVYYRYSLFIEGILHQVSIEFGDEYSEAERVEILMNLVDSFQPSLSESP